MVGYFKLGAVAIALGLISSAYAAQAGKENAPVELKDSLPIPAPAKTAPVTAPTEVAPAMILQAPAQGVDASEEKPKGKLRFIERAGTGGSKTVGTAKPIVFPEGPQGKAPEDIHKLLAEAQKAGGERLDVYQKEINLPGLKKDDPSLKPFVLHTRNGVNEIVRMSGRMLNRVATPFKKPVLIDTTDSVSKIVGSDIYYTPSGDKPIGLFIVDSANTSQTISLTIIPAYDIPGQNLIIKLEDLRTVDTLAVASSQEEAEIQQPRASDYSGYVRTLLTQAVRGKVNGFSPIPLEGGIAMMGTLQVQPEVAFAGSIVDIYRYKILNLGSEPLDLVETAFSRKGVKAVSFFPRLSLQPGEGGYVFLLADKPSAATGSDQELK